MEMDGVERFFALKPEESVTVKGLTEVRRNTCELIFYIYLKMLHEIHSVSEHGWA